MWVCLTNTKQNNMAITRNMLQKNGVKGQMAAHINHRVSPTHVIKLKDVHTHPN